MANQAKGKSRWAIPPTTQTTIAVDIPQETELTLRQDCGKLPTASPTSINDRPRGCFAPAHV
jgi:hypothetical protein